MKTTRIANWSVVVIAGSVLVGCGKSAPEPAAATPASQVSDHGHSHEGWWCNEHGVPEEVCALCSAKLADEFKAKGDWCAEHDRPDSQCFDCHPELEAEFAARYEAKYGQKPPRPTADGEAHDHEHTEG
jgi:cobalt-zinc-cadmium efflux system membrane fusion protein